MACRLVGAKPLSEPILEYCSLELRNKLQWNFDRNSNVFIQENALKTPSAKWHPFCLGLNALTYPHVSAACCYWPSSSPEQPRSPRARSGTWWRFCEVPDQNRFKWAHIDGLVQDCGNSIALSLELLQSCTKPQIYNCCKTKEKWINKTIWRTRENVCPIRLSFEQQGLISNGFLNAFLLKKNNS